MNWDFNHAGIAMGLYLAVCTCRRADWTPYTYDQKLKPNDRRESVPKKGPKTWLQKTCTDPQSSVKVNFFAYHNGNNGVTLLLSTTGATRHSTKFKEIIIGGETIGEMPEQEAKRQRLYKDNVSEQLTVGEQNVRSR